MLNNPDSIHLGIMNEAFTLNLKILSAKSRVLSIVPDEYIPWRFSFYYLELRDNILYWSGGIFYFNNEEKYNADKNCWILYFTINTYCEHKCACGNDEIREIKDRYHVSADTQEELIPKMLAAIARRSHVLSKPLCTFV